MPKQQGLPKPQGIDRLDAEIARVREEINALMKRIDGLSHLRSAAVRFKDEFDLVPIRRSTHAVHVMLSKPGKSPTKRDQILDACKEILSDGKRRFARELLPDLKLRGVVVGGRNEKVEKSNLASYLSHSDEFVADTKLGGWTLRSLLPPKAKASNARTLPAFSTNGALPGRHQLAGSPREGGLQFD